MLIAVTVLASLALFGWLIVRAIRQKDIRAHTIVRTIAYITGIYTYAYFLTIDIPQLFKITASIILGAILIVLAAYIQRKREQKQ